MCLFLFESLDSRGVNSNGNIPDHTVPNVFTIDWDNRSKRAVSTLGAFRVDRILGVGSAVDLSMRDIRLHRHDLLLNLLVEIHLSSTDGVTCDDCAVLSGSPFCVNLDVNVDCALDVETY